MATILDQIVAYKREEVEKAKRNVPLEVMEHLAVQSPAPRNFYKAVTRDSDTIHVIAEVKKASPSAGIIRDDFDPVRIALQYESNGASAISCLTDEKFFQGSLSYLKAIKEVVSIPVLRKDFIIDRYQLFEARHAGADAVLLIAECLSEANLVDMLICATELKMTVLLEVHEVESLLKVRPHIGFPHAGYCLLGINNRNLKEMKTDLGHTFRLLEMVEEKHILVSESGIRTHADVTKLKAAGVNTVLVGEHLMKQPDPGLALRELKYGNQ